MNTLNWANLIIIIIIIIYLVIITIIYFTNLNKVNRTGIPLLIIEGTKIGSTDTYTMRGNTIYLAQSSQTSSRNGFILNINVSSDKEVGQVAYIKNTTSSNITVRGITAIINVAGLTSTITGGQTGVYMAMDGNIWMRLE